MTNLFDSLVGNRVKAGAGAQIAIEVEGGSAWTYGDLAAASSRMAGAIRDCGAKPGDRVAVQVDKSAQCLALYLAIVRMGAIYVPMNTDYTPAEVEKLVSDARPAVLIGSQRLADSLPKLGLSPGPEFLSLESDGAGELARRSLGSVPYESVLPVAVDDVAAILYTSGTTGRPKGAMLTHGNLGFVARTLCETWEITGSDVLLHVLPLFHAHGLFVAASSALHAGARIILLPKFSVDAVIARLPESTVFMGVPTLYSRLLGREGFGRDACAGMRLFTSGSAPLSTELFETFEARTGHTILERYGMTETTIVTSNPLHGERVAGTVGYALPGVDVRLGERGRTADDVGELEVRGPNVFKSYWGMPESTAEVMHPDGFFRSGDIARIDGDGRITLVGRSKDLIITGGFNVYPREVEEVLCGTPGIHDAVVIGVPHPDFGEGVIAVAEREPGFPAATEDQILKAATHVLAKYKVPKRLYFVDALPRNTMGKVLKTELRASYDSVFADQQPGAAL